jgi:hypothetical protein
VNLPVAAFAIFTLAVLVITFYFPLYGLGAALDSSASFSDRWEGAVIALPSASLLVFLIGMIPQLRGLVLLLTGIGATLLLVPPVIACARMGFPAALGCVAAVAYSGLWWHLAKPRFGS